LKDSTETNYLKRFHECGPLAFDTLAEKVYIGREELPVSSPEFTALYLLAQISGKFITFELLYKSVWDVPYYQDMYDSPEEYTPPVGRDEARRQMENMMSELNAVGKGRAHIEYEPEKGYCLRL